MPAVILPLSQRVLRAISSPVQVDARPFVETVIPQFPEVLFIFEAACLFRGWHYFFKGLEYALNFRAYAEFYEVRSPVKGLFFLKQFIVL